MRSARQRMASRRNLIKARQKKVRSHDTIGHYFRMGVRKVANTPTKSYAGKVSNFIEGKHQKRPGKLSKFYKDRSGKRRRKR